MVNKLTSAELIIKAPQFIEEATEGTTPTIGTPTLIGINSMISIKKNGNWVEVPQLSSEDLAGLVQGTLKFPVQIKYNPGDSTFLKYGVNSANYGTPAGTISKSLSVIFSCYFNGAENFIVISGFRPESCQLDIEIGKPITVTMSAVSMLAALPTTTAPTGLTLVTTPYANPAWSWLTGGTGPVAYGGTGQDCQKFSVTIKRNTKEEYVLGANTPMGSLSHGRRIAISGDFLWDGIGTFEADCGVTPIARTIAVVLKSATSTLTLSGGQVTDYDRSPDISNSKATIESITGKALTAVVT